jgi:spore germination cell wall hydrolase CwlJ-like protein
MVVALCSRATGALSAPFLLSALCAALMPTAIGCQDLAGSLARQPGVVGHWHDHLIASPFGTIHATTFSFARPIGTAMSEPLGAEPVNFDPRSLDVKTWWDAPPAARPGLSIAYPIVNRRLKGDRMPMPQSAPDVGDPPTAPASQPVDAPASQPASPSAPVIGPRPKSADKKVEQVDPGRSPHDLPNEILGAAPASERQPPETTASIQAVAPAPGARAADLANNDAVAERPPETEATGEDETLRAPPSFASLSFADEDMAERNAQLYFGVAAMGSRALLEPWAPGAEPILVSPSLDPEIKLSALEDSADANAGGETAATKNDASGFKSPADRLGLVGRPRARAEKCIADAVYFEARGEPLRGQEAVAQVVMNRVFSGRYPNDVCGVVYQNADRHLACQFTFACEGKDLSRIDEPDMWEQAKRIAKDTLDGKIWLSEVGHATHYHAYWVHPSWVHEMAKLYQLGVHTFYRPRAWGDGSDAPVWSNVPAMPKPISAPAPEASTAPQAHRS